MADRKTYSNKFDPDIIPALAEKRSKAYSARSLPVNAYLEMLVLRDAGRRETLGEPVHDEAALLARIGSLIAFADASLPAGFAQTRDFLNAAQRAIFARTSELKETIAGTQALRSQEAWRDAGSVRFEGYPERKP